jgi:hypothetical protein
MEYNLIKEPENANIEIKSNPSDNNEFESLCLIDSTINGWPAEVCDTVISDLSINEYMSLTNNYNNDFINNDDKITFEFEYEGNLRSIQIPNYEKNIAI